MKKKNLLMTALVIFGLASITNAQVPSYVPTNGLVGYWPFNGNANDESGNGNNGTVNGATLTVDRFGVANNAYSFDGSDWIEVNSNPNQNVGAGSFTLSCWSLKNGSNNFDHLITRNSGTSNQDFISSYSLRYQNGTIGVAGSSSAQANLNNGGCSSSQLNDLNNWNFFIAIFDSLSATYKLFKNGILISSCNLNQSFYSFNNNGKIYFGVENPTANLVSGPLFLNGNLDDIGIWNRALSECEIQDLYASQVNSTFVNAGADQTICNGDPVTLSAINSLNFSWDNGVADGVAFNPTSTQDYTVSADSVGCLSTDVVTVTVNENTSATQIQTALDSYTWPINSQTYTQSGTYTAVIPNAAGCDSTITLDLSLDFTGISEFSENNLFTVFPNPAQSAINIKADNKLIGDVYTIYDNTGRVALTGKLNSKDTTIELNNLSGGIYLFSVGENLKQTFKVIKE